MGLGQDVNNQKKELGEMALRAGQSFKMNGVTVKEDDITKQQEKWCWEENIGKPVDKRSYSHLNPEQKFYLCLAAEGFKLNEAKERAHQLGIMTSQELETAQEALALHVNDDDQVTAVTRPSFVGADFVTDPEIKKLLEAAVVKSPRCLYGADLEGANLYGAQLREADLRRADLRGAQMRHADLREADLRRADLRGAQMRGVNLRDAVLWEADLRGAQMQGADLRGARMQGADISGANFQDAKNLQDTYLDLAFYCQDNPPKNLEDALEGVDVKQRPMALTKQEYDHLRNLRDSKDSSFTDELKRLRDVCNTRIDSQQQVDAAVNAAKAKFAWCQPLVSTTVAIMFSQGFDAQTRAAWYGNGAGGNVLQGISNRLEGLNNHLVGRGSR
jgi:hypothetical protein